MVKLSGRTVSSSLHKNGADTGAPGRGRTEAGELRLPGLHPLLGPESQGQLGRETQNGREPVLAGITDDHRMVPAAPSFTFASATAGVEPEASGALLVLRPDGERSVVEPLPVRGALHLATPSGEKEPPGPALVEVPSPVGTLPVADCTGGSFHLPPSRSEPMTRGAVCVNRARTDLWEPRVGNRPGPPD